MEITLRPGSLTDLDTMYTLDRLCFTAAFRFSRRTFQVLLAESGCRSVVAESDGVLVGFILLHASQQGSSGVYITTLDVHPAHRRKGIAGRLMLEAERIASSIGAAAVLLHVWTGNADALRFYQSRGYRSLGHEDSYYGPGIDALRLGKSVLPA